jgi:hypothetical protein
MMKKLDKNRCFLSQCLLLAAIIAQWWQPVASVVALNHLYWAICAVLYPCIAMAIKTASKVGVLFDCCFVGCCPGGRWDSTEQVVARCRHPVASGVSVDMPHWAMLSVLLRHTSVAVETADGQGAFVRHR